MVPWERENPPDLHSPAALQLPERKGRLLSHTQTILETKFCSYTGVQQMNWWGKRALITRGRKAQAQPIPVLLAEAGNLRSRTGTPWSPKKCTPAFSVPREPWSPAPAAQAPSSLHTPLKEQHISQAHASSCSSHFSQTTFGFGVCFFLAQP